MTTFVSVGNALQPFSRLLNEVVRILDQLPQPVVVQHGHTPFRGPGCVARDFVNPVEYSELMASSSLLILHAGAGSVLNAIRAGRVPVVVPRLQAHAEHVNDHQVEFARQLARAGCVELVEDVRDLPQAVRRAQIRRADASRGAGQALIDDLRAVLTQHVRRIQEHKRYSRNP